MRRIFLLSPADGSGERARMVLNPEARCDLAVRLRSPGGAPLGEVYSFVSGLYFRGKLAYAAAFSRPPSGLPGAMVIAPGRGLVAPEERVTIAALRRMTRVPVDEREARYRRPLRTALRGLAAAIDGRRDACDVVLLGSVATTKYLVPLAEVLGGRVLFPSAFIGRGDLSRGSLLLRAAREGRELEYRAIGELIVDS